MTKSYIDGTKVPWIVLLQVSLILIASHSSVLAASTFAPRSGEIELQGFFQSYDASAKTITIRADSVKLPDGSSVYFDNSRKKVVNTEAATVTPDPADSPSGWSPKNGDLVIVVGTNLSAGGVLKARIVGLFPNSSLQSAVNAVEKDDVSSLKAYIDSGAPLDVSATAFGGTLLDTACSEGKTDCVKALIAGGANVNAQIRVVGFFPLFCATMNGHADCVTLLVNAGVRVDEQSTSGLTALMFAAESNQVSTAKVLLDLHANPRLRDQYGHDALWHAGYPNPKSNGRHNTVSPGIIKLLQAALAK